MPKGPLFSLSSTGGEAEGRRGAAPLPIKAWSASRPRCLRNRRCVADSCPSFGDSGRGAPGLTAAPAGTDEAGAADKGREATFTAGLGPDLWGTAEDRSTTPLADGATDALFGGVDTGEKEDRAESTGVEGVAGAIGTGEAEGATTG